MRLGRRDGFTLIELLIAMSLSTMVLIGIVSVTASVMRHHFDSIRRGEANEMTLFALQQMNTELERATYIMPNFPGVGGGSVIRGCLNYSSYIPGDGRYDSTQPSSYFVYCVRSDGNDTDTPPQAQYSLIRYSGSPCSAMGTPDTSCGTAGSYEVVVNKRFNPIGTQPYFSRTSDRRLRLQYTVGVSTQTAKTQSPVFFRIDTTVSPEKSYNTPND